ncbi:MAG: hypothetical protein JWM74_1918 [Myxococcaceae bacterium]|nr:hypothetical protein [Myxococcaceae bacterium]
MQGRRRYLWVAAGAVALASLSTVAVGCTDDAAITIVDDAGSDGPSNDATVDAPKDSPNDAIPTGPVALFPPGPIDLGAADCGGTALTKTVAIQNTGGKALTIGVTTSGAPFTVTPSSLTIDPGQTGSMVLTVAVPSTATAGTKITGSITVTTNDPSKPSVTVPVTVTPEGATLVFNTGSPTSADFGQAPLGTPDTPINLTLKNTGNKAATVAFGAPTNSQYSLTATPASPSAVAANGTIALVAGFTPSSPLASPAVSNLTITGALCGTSVNKISFSGQGTAGDVSGWPTQQLDFGSNPCGGAAAAPKTFTLTNTGSQDVTLTGVTVGTKGYTVSGAAVGAKVLKNGGTLVVTVTAPAIPSPSPIPGNYNDTLTITTDLTGDAPHTIPLAQGALGAILAFDTSGTTNFGAFGKVPVGSTASQSLKVTNSGNGPSIVTLGAGNPFGVTPTDFTVTASSGVPTVQNATATFSPVNTTPASAPLTIKATGLCQPLPDPLTLTGTGQNGGVAVSETSLSFSANCGTTAGAKTFTITNSGNVPMTWTAVLGRDTSSPYTFSPSTATLAAGDASTVTVTPKLIPQTPADPKPAAFKDTLTISTNVIGDTPRDVQLNETPIGAILTFDQPTNQIDFGDVPVNTSSSPLPFAVLNNGNAGSDVAVTINSSDAGVFPVQTGGGVVPSGGMLNTTATFIPGASPGNQSGSISINVPESTPLCAPIARGGLRVQGNGTLAGVKYGPAALDFNPVEEQGINCGSVGSAQDITFTNVGNQSYTITAATLGKGAASYFTVSIAPASGIVTPTGSVVVTITPKPIPQTVPSVPDTATYSDDLTITTNAAQDAPHIVPLTMSAQGVILRALPTKTWDFGSITANTSETYNISIDNDGNVGTTISATGYAAPFSFNNTFVQPENSTFLSATFTPTAAQSYVDSGTLLIAPGTVFCQPPPDLTAVTMQGKGVAGQTFSVTPLVVFPPVDCSAPANAPKNVVITNAGTTTLSYTTQFEKGTYYTTGGGSGSGTVDPGTTANIQIVPSQIVAGPTTSSGPGPYADHLYVTINGDAYSVEISQTARGAELSYSGQFSAGTFSTFQCFPDPNTGFPICGPVSYTQDGSITVHNAGNASVSFDPTVTFSNPNSDGAWTINPTPNAVNANGGDSNQTLQYSRLPPRNACFPYDLVLAASVTGPVCKPLPATQALTGCEQSGPVGGPGPSNN